MMFTKEEYLARLDKVKKSMEKKGIDVLLVTNPANICYTIGYDAWSFYVHQIVVIAQDEEMPYFIGRYMDAFAGVVKMTYLDEKHVYAYPDYYVQRDMFFPIFTYPYSWYQVNSPELLFVDEDDDGNIRRGAVGPQLPENGDSVLVREHDIEQNERGLSFGHCRPERPRRGKALCLKLLALQRVDDQLANAVIVLQKINQSVHLFLKW